MKYYRDFLFLHSRYCYSMAKRLGEDYEITNHSITGELIMTPQKFTKKMIKNDCFESRKACKVVFNIITRGEFII